MKNIGEILQKMAIEDKICRLVVGCIVQHDGRFIILQRNSNKFMQDINEVPGGKIDFGETIEQCLHRQVKEELGKNIKKIKKYLGYFDYLSQTGMLVRQYNFLIELDSYEDFVLSDEHKNISLLTMSDCEQNNKISDELKFILNIANSDKIFENIKEKYNECWKRSAI